MWVDILVCCPVELAFSAARVLRVLCGGLLQSWKSRGTVGRTVGQGFLLDQIGKLQSSTVLTEMCRSVVGSEWRSGCVACLRELLQIVFGRLFRGSWVQTSCSVQFVTVVRRIVWEVGAEFRGSDRLLAVEATWVLVVLLRSLPVLADSGDRIL